MRLFLSVELSPEIKEVLYGRATQLKKSAKRGSITRKNNFHLTLVFLGESDRIKAVRRAMDRVCAEPFDLILEMLGSFHRGNTQLFWIGVRQNEMLERIYEQLVDALQQEGFSLKKREFYPHVTIAREMILPKDFDLAVFSASIEPLKMRVNKIGLMKSERIDGVLVYTEIGAKKFYKN
jgi:2'-5' RNA ligase